MELFYVWLQCAAAEHRDLEEEPVLALNDVLLKQEWVLD